MRLLLLCSLLVACGFEAVSTEATVGADAAVRVDAFVPQIDAPPSGLAPLTPEGMVSELVTRTCERAFACRPEYPPDRDFVREWGANLTECIALDDNYQQLPKITAAIAGGTITFDPASAASCLANPGLPASCATLFAQITPWADTCYAALVGHIADGGACTTDWQCAIGSVCRGARCERF